MSDSGDYVGGIAGQTGSTVRQSYAKCTPSGSRYVGGIVGAGVAQTVSGSSSTVTGCYSMVKITDAAQFSGAVSGSDAESLPITISFPIRSGLDTVSRTGKAEPISYDELLDVPTVPDGMRQLELRFVADEETLKVQTFQYGDPFDETIYPDIPEKDGYYGQWDDGPYRPAL